MRLAIFSLALLAVSSSLAKAQNCPKPPSRLADIKPIVESQSIVYYRTGFQIDLDGAANAYQADAGGIEHICSGVDVEELRGGLLIDKYPPDRFTAITSAACKVDFLRLRNAGFPACSSGECIRFYGVISTPRACGFPPHKSDTGCGIPIQQKDANNQPTIFYVSATRWQRKGARQTDQNGFLDARFVPYLVYNSAQLAAKGVSIGDLALVAWSGHATFAIYGDSGGHLCEASVATANRLFGKSDSERPNWRVLGIAGGANVIAFPRSARYLDTSFPDYKSLHGVTPGQQIYAAGLKALTAAGTHSASLSLIGLVSQDQISTH